MTEYDYYDVKMFDALDEMLGRMRYYFMEDNTELYWIGKCRHFVTMFIFTEDGEFIKDFLVEFENDKAFITYRDTKILLGDFKQGEG